MKNVHIALLLLCCLAYSRINGQLFLHSPIGLNGLPSDSDSICTIPNYLGNFDVTGLQPGDTLADFTFYDVSGDSVNLQTELQKGKPLLMVTGSYTCPVFRKKVAVLNQVASTYANDLSVFVIYTVEAHPSIDISPYFGYVNTTNANQQAGILYRQPNTYGERKTVVSDMLNDLTLNFPVYLDGPCNEWWEHYGPAPQNGYLINTNGTVFTKHSWFDKFPNDIFCDIDSLLGNPVNCGAVANGSFQFYMVSDTVDVDTPGATLSVYGNIVNSSGGLVDVLCVKLQNNIPGGWATSLCTDVCYPTTVDTLLMQLQPGDTQSFTFYFYTDGSPNSGNARVGFRNQNDFQNKFAVRLYGETDENFVGVWEEEENTNIRVWPNPASDLLRVKLSGPLPAQMRLYDLSGNLLIQQEVHPGGNEIEVRGLSPGLYFWQVGSEFGKTLIR